MITISQNLSRHSSFFNQSRRLLLFSNKIFFNVLNLLRSILSKISQTIMTLFLKNASHHQIIENYIPLFGVYTNSFNVDTSKRIYIL